MEGIKLIPATDKDFEGYYNIKCGDSDIFWIGFTGKPNKENLRKCFLGRLGDVREAKPGEKRIYVANSPETGDEVLGIIQFDYGEDGIEIGISVNEKMQGKGIGKASVKAALEILSCIDARVFTRIRDDNIRSQKCFLSNGFKRTELFENVNFPQSGTIKFRTYELIE